MRLRAFIVVVIVSAAVRAAGQTTPADAVAGTWGVDGRTLLELTVDERGAVGGTAYFHGPSGPPVAMRIATGRFDPASRTLALEASVPVPGAAAPATWTLAGTLETQNSLRVTMAFGPTTANRVLSRVNTAPLAAPAGTVFITGANRGLGLEFAKQYAAAGWRVIATARDPDTATELRALLAANPRVTLDELDLLDREGIAALAAKYRATAIDVVLNNGGVLGEMAAQQLGSLDYGAFEEVMAVNVFGALAVAEAFREHVAASREKKIVSLTSRSGIISLPGSRGPYFYRASKTALNMVMRVLADDLRPRGIIVAVVSPPPTDTDMLRALIGPDAAARQGRPETTVAGLIKVIAGLTPDQSGGAPIYFDGTTLPW